MPISTDGHIYQKLLIQPHVSSFPSVAIVTASSSSQRASRMQTRCCLAQYTRRISLVDPNSTVRFIEPRLAPRLAASLTMPLGRPKIDLEPHRVELLALIESSISYTEIRASLLIAHGIIVGYSTLKR